MFCFFNASMTCFPMYPLAPVTAIFIYFSPLVMEFSMISSNFSPISFSLGKFSLTKFFRLMLFDALNLDLEYGNQF